jgi:sulfite exporter TauE/SafE
MYYIAFTLGLFGSLHCLGMCGPLALAAQGVQNDNTHMGLLKAIIYNSGRAFSYILLGLIFGLVGSILAFTGYQKGISIFSGVILIGLFAFSLKPDELLNKVPLFNKGYMFIQKNFGKWISRNELFSKLVLGVFNGFLPCGMVYIALAGALSLQNIWGSMGFMLFFALGTFPAMIGIMMAGKWFQNRWRFGLQKIYPIVSLGLGLYLVYRGVFSTTPLQLNFLEALKNPVMCH